MVVVCGSVSVWLQQKRNTLAKSLGGAHVDLSLLSYDYIRIVQS